MQIASDVTGNHGVFTDMNEAIEAAKKAQKVVARMSLDHREKLSPTSAKRSWRTQRSWRAMGVQGDRHGKMSGHKILKHQLVAEKTPERKISQQQHGRETEDLTLIEMGPFGVIGAITPCTNPSETVLCNTIGMFAAGNTVVFNPHRRPSRHPSTRSTL